MQNLLQYFKTYILFFIQEISLSIISSGLVNHFTLYLIQKGSSLALNILKLINICINLKLLK